MTTGPTNQSNQPEGSGSPEIKLRESEPLSHNPFVHLTLDPVQTSDNPGGSSHASAQNQQPRPASMYYQQVSQRGQERPSRVSRSFPNKQQVPSGFSNVAAPAASPQNSAPPQNGVSEAASKAPSGNTDSSSASSSSQGPSLRVVLEHSDDVKVDPAHKDKSADVQIGADHISVPQGLHTKEDLEDMAASFPMIPKSLIFEEKPQFARKPGAGMPGAPGAFVPGQMGAHATAPLNGAVSVPGNPRNMAGAYGVQRSVSPQGAFGVYQQPGVQNPYAQASQAGIFGQSEPSLHGMNAALWSQNPALGSLSPYNPNSLQFSGGNIGPWYGADALPSPSSSGALGQNPYMAGAGMPQSGIYGQNVHAGQLSPSASGAMGMQGARFSDFDSPVSRSGNIGMPSQTGSVSYGGATGQWGPVGNSGASYRNPTPNGYSQNRAQSASFGNPGPNRAPQPGPNRVQQPSSIHNAPQAPVRSGIANGKPLISSTAADESSIFDQPPVPISEGMKDAESNHKRGRRWLIVVILVLLLAIGGTVGYLALSGTVDFASLVPGIQSSDDTSDGEDGDGSGSSGSASGTSGQNGSNTSGTDSTQQGTSTSGSDGSSTGASGSSGADDAGSVVYQYTASTSDGTTYSVEETATFTEDGYCSFTTMVMSFPDAAKAKAFTDNLARDYGSSFTLDSLDGAVATVTIDNSSLHLDREEYENSLRFSVEDLVILKK